MSRRKRRALTRELKADAVALCAVGDRSIARAFTGERSATLAIRCALTDHDRSARAARFNRRSRMPTVPHVCPKERLS